jgi:hypothetical protein
MPIFKSWPLVINWVAASTLYYCDLVSLLDLDKPLIFLTHPLIWLIATGKCACDVLLPYLTSHV